MKVPEVELLSFDDLPILPSWLDSDILPNIHRDQLVRKIKVLELRVKEIDKEDIQRKQRYMEWINRGNNLYKV